jgi:hypothetical protein
MAGYRLKVRAGSRVERSKHDDLDAAMAALEARAGELRRSARRGRVDIKISRFDPVQQVTARLELAGKGLRAGIDIRGDGSIETWTGRFHRELVEQRPGESPFDALRRVA